MIDEKFKKMIEAEKGCAVVMAGSYSDRPHIEKIVKALDKYQIPHQERICSAHKQPGKLMELIDEYNSIYGAIAYVAIAGGTDALSGTLAFHATGPVITCPPDATPKEPNMTGLTNPPGSSNAYIARPKNVARFIAQTFSSINPEYKKILEEEKKEKIHSLDKADRNALEGYLSKD